MAGKKRASARPEALTFGTKRDVPNRLTDAKPSEPAPLVLPRAYFEPGFFIRDGGDLARPLHLPVTSVDPNGVRVDFGGRRLLVPWCRVQYVEG